MQLGSKETENERFAHYLTKTYRKTASLIANSVKAVSEYKIMKVNSKRFVVFNCNSRTVYTPTYFGFPYQELVCTYKLSKCLPFLALSCLNHISSAFQRRFSSFRVFFSNLNYILV